MASPIPKISKRIIVPTVLSLVLYPMISPSLTNEISDIPTINHLHGCFFSNVISLGASPHVFFLLCIARLCGPFDR